MGQLVDGVWEAQPGALIKRGADGAFQRAASVFRNWITADGDPGPSGRGGYKAESGRYHLYVSYACPWAHRTLIFRALKGLEPHISVDAVHPDMLDQGWTFSEGVDGATGDRLFGTEYLYQIYARAEPSATTRVTVPVLWDKDTGTIVSNESSEIIRMLDSAFDGITGPSERYWPEDLRAEMEPVNDRIYETVNNGVYRSGFAGTQGAYDAAVGALFDSLDWLETRLDTRRYLMGARLTEADWRLWTTLVRFDAVYHGHFKCARSRLVDFPNLWAYARELYQWPGVAGTVRFDHIRRHYHYSHETVNPHRIVPIASRVDWDAPHGRARLDAA